MSLLKKANILFREKRYAEAVPLYEKAIASQPLLATHIMVNLNLALDKSKKHKAPSSERCSLKHNYQKENYSPDIKWHPEALDIEYEKGALFNMDQIKHKELISVIIPSYNNSRYLRRAINSALSQRGVHIEVIVVDDGSTDDSLHTALAIAKTNPNVQVHSLLRNFGCYYARNFALQNAKGRYVALIDSDDIVAPNFLAASLDALKANPEFKACRSLQRRWKIDYSQPLSDLKPGESSLVWSRDMQKTIGWYDCVRFGGDTEFRFRLQRATGMSTLMIQDELYFARTVETSLTMASNSSTFTIEENKISAKPNETRLRYFDNFTSWQKENKPTNESSGKSKNLYVQFPLLNRNFPLAGMDQNASPSLNQKIFGAIASFPPRKDSLESTIYSILPQLDSVCVYLNNYESVPEFLNHPKITVIRSDEAHGDLRDNGKFFAIPNDDNHYVFTFDDDLIYPTDYVARMIHNIEMLGRTAVVGLHGVIFPENFTKLPQRKVFHFSQRCNGNFVDLLGTGTTAWHSSTLKLNIGEFLTKGVCDLWFATAAAKRNIPLFSIKRDDNWLKLFKKHEENLYVEALQNPRPYFDVYDNYLKPALDGGRLRKECESHLVCGFDAVTLNAAGIEILNDQPTGPMLPAQPYKQTLFLNGGNGRSKPESLHFHLVVNGWNCRDLVDDCLRSIANQLPASYTYDVTLVDDASTDGTFEKLAASTILPRAKLIRIEENTGPAYARHIGISLISDPETIVVTLDMDDALEPNALKIVAEKYKKNPDCLLTIGNWHDQYGKINPQGFYTDHEINGQCVRSVDVFNATQLRTFRRKLYDTVTKEDLLDPQAKWLETCTDVALMYPLLDQCWASEVEFIKEPIYKYTRKHSNGTLARFGKPHKVERLAWLKAKKAKPRLNAKETL